MSYNDRQKRERKVAHDELKRLLDVDFHQILLALPKIMKLYEDIDVDQATPGVKQAIYAAVGETHAPIEKWKKHNLLLDADLKKAMAKLAD